MSGNKIEDKARETLEDGVEIASFLWVEHKSVMARGDMTFMRRALATLEDNWAATYDPIAFREAVKIAEEYISVSV